MPKKRLCGLNASQQKIIDAYLQKLTSRISVAGVVLFGSHAYGKPTKHSDIDLIVLSSDFTTYSFGKRLIFLSRMRKDVAEDIALDVIGYTPKEFYTIEQESAIGAQAKKKGVWLRSGAPGRP